MIRKLIRRSIEYRARSPRSLGQDVAAAAAISALALLVRYSLDLAFETLPAYALTYPAALLATLFFSARAGAMTAAVCAIGTWWLIVARGKPFDDSLLGLLLALTALALIIYIAAEHEQVQRRLLRERLERQSEAMLLLRESNHRIKNNFQIISLLLQRRMRNVDDPAALDALNDATAQIHALSELHDELARYGDIGGVVSLKSYLGRLCELMEQAMFQSPLELDCELEESWIETDRVVAIGLIVVELVANSVKHADSGGALKLRLIRGSGALVVEVIDGGPQVAGAHRDVMRSGGMGQAILDALARQAGGTVSWLPAPQHGRALWLPVDDTTLRAMNRRDAGSADAVPAVAG